MNKKIWILVVAVVVISTCGYFVFKEQRGFVPQAKAPTVAVFNPLNATYIVDGQAITLVNGSTSSQAAPSSAAQIVTRVFGQPVSGDLNGDGTADAALMLVQDSGGSGTFYYVAAALHTATGTQGTNAVLLGDRIAPQNIQIQDGRVVANYADRTAEEPMSASPSLGISKYLIYNGSELVVTPPVAAAGEHCGGNMMTAAVCGTGYHCAPIAGSHLPFGDVGGVCVKD